MTHARDDNDTATLYRRHAPALHRLAFLMTGDRESADDIVQEAFVRMIARLGHVRNVDRLDYYLRRTVVNVTNGYFRRRAVERRHAQRRSEATAHDVPTEIAMSQDLGTSLRRLPVRQRAALILRYYEDLTEADVGEVMGISRRAASSLISRGLAALREEQKEAAR